VVNRKGVWAEKVGVRVEWGKYNHVDSQIARSIITGGDCAWLKNFTDEPMWL